MAKLTNPNEAPADETHDSSDGGTDEGTGAGAGGTLDDAGETSGEEAQSAKEKFRAALDAKKAREHEKPGGGPLGPDAGHAHGAAGGGQKRMRRKSG